MTWYDVLVGAVSVVLAGCLGLIAFVATTKVARARALRRARLLLAPYRSALIGVGAGEDPDGRAVATLRGLHGPAGDAVDGAAAGLLAKIRGLPAADLIEVLRAHGVIERARHDMGARSPFRRARAARLLGLCGDGEARSLLETAVCDRDLIVRTCAVQALGHLGGEPAGGGPEGDGAGIPADPGLGSARAILRATGLPGGGLPAGEAAAALGQLGVGIADALLEGLAAHDPRTRTVAAHVSGFGGFTRSLPLLRALVVDDLDLTVRETSTRAIGAIGRPEDGALLVGIAGAGEPLSLRRACVEAVGAIGDARVATALAGLTRDPDPPLAELAAAVLVRLGDPGRAALEAVNGSRPNDAVASALVVAGLQGALR